MKDQKYYSVCCGELMPDYPDSDFCPRCKTPTVAGACMTSNNKRSLYCVNGNCNYDVPFESLTTPIKNKPIHPEPIYKSPEQLINMGYKPEPKPEIEELDFSGLSYKKEDIELVSKINEIIRFLKKK